MYNKCSTWGLLLCPIKAINSVRRAGVKWWVGTWLPHFLVFTSQNTEMHVIHKSFLVSQDDSTGTFELYMTSQSVKHLKPISLSLTLREIFLSVKIIDNNHFKLFQGIHFFIFFCFCFLVVVHQPKFSKKRQVDRARWINDWPSKTQ